MSEKAAARFSLTEGDILQKLLQVAVPIMGTQFMQMSYNLTDMFWLGRVGPDAVAASGTAGMFMWLSMAFLLIGRMGAEIGVSQSLGRGERGVALQFAQNALLLAGMLGITYGGALFLFRGPLVGFFNIQEANVAADTRGYLAIVAAAMPLNFLTAACIGAFNASGNSRTPFFANAAGLVANMALDPLLILAFDMGVAGAAIATVASQAVAFALMLRSMLRHKNRPFERFRFAFRLDGAIVRRILKWSVPIGLESMLFTMMAMVTARFISAFGASAIAVNKVGTQIESLSWLIGGGFGSALTAFMGQNFGAGKWTRIREGFRLSVVVMSLWGVAITAGIYLGAAFLFSIFLADPEIVRMGVDYLHILALCQIPQCFESIAGSTFKGVGRTLPPSIVSITSNVLRVFLTFFLSRTALGLNGIWLGISLSAVLRGLWSFGWYLLYARKQPRADALAAA